MNLYSTRWYKWIGCQSGRKEKWTGRDECWDGVGNSEGWVSPCLWQARDAANCSRPTQPSSPPGSVNE